MKLLVVDCVEIPVIGMSAIFCKLLQNIVWSGLLMGGLTFLANEEKEKDGLDGQKYEATFCNRPRRSGMKCQWQGMVMRGDILL